MQLDKTRIVIRERSHAEIIDLTFHMLRAHAGPLLKVALAGIAPCMLANFLLLGWIAVPASDELAAVDYTSSNARYYSDMVLLVFLQAPLATGLITIYLGKAVFLDRPTFREVLQDFRTTWKPFVWTSGVIRLAIPATLLMTTIWGSDDYHGSEMLLCGMALVAATLRSWRPYLPEIVLLEKTPLTSADAKAITIGTRSSRLHGGPASSDSVSRWIASCLVHGILLYVTLASVVFLQGTLAETWRISTPFMLYVAFPAAIWCVAAFSAVCRFLSYLDTRIRNEGWEVELLLRAEGNRLREIPLAG